MGPAPTRRSPVTAVIASVALLAAVAAAATFTPAQCDTTSRYVTWCTVDRIGTEVRVNRVTDNGQLRPSIAALAPPSASTATPSDYVIVWQSEAQDGSHEGIYAKIVSGSTGATRVIDFLVNTEYTNNSQSHPAVAGLPDGSFVVTWQSMHDASTNYAEGVYAKHYSALGSVLRGATLVNTHRPNGQREPSIAARAGSGYYIVWTSELQDGSLDGIYARTFFSSASASAEYRVNVERNGAQRHPSVASLGTAGFVVVWETVERSATANVDGVSIVARVFSTIGLPLTGEIIVAGGVEGTAITSVVRAFPSVKAHGTGGSGFVVAWETSSATGGEYISARIFNSTWMPAGNEIRVTSTTGIGGQRMPAVVSGIQDDGFIVAWQSDSASGGNDDDTYMQVFTATGTKVLGETRLNIETRQAQTRPQLAVLTTTGPGATLGGSNSVIAAVWESDGQDDSVKGIYSHRLRYGVPQRPATCAVPLLDLYDAEPAGCDPLDTCRQTMCACMRGSPTTTTSALAAVNSSGWFCLTNGSATVFKSLNCTTQQSCFVAYRKCVEIAAYVVTGTSVIATSASSECRTWGRLVRDVTGVATGANYNGSTLQESCSATACNTYLRTPSRCSFVEGGTDDTISAVCAEPPSVAELLANAATPAPPVVGGGPSGGGGSGTSGTPSPVASSTPRPPSAPTPSPAVGRLPPMSACVAFVAAAAVLVWSL